MKKIRLIILSVVLVLMSSVNLWATDYMFGITKSSTKYFLAIPASPSSSGNCDVVSNPNQDTYQRCIWHCVDGTGSSATSQNISSDTGYYLYATIPGSSTKYWLRNASNNKGTIRYTTNSSNANKFKFDDTGLLVSSSYYTYFDGTNICTTNSSSTYSGKLLTIGSYAAVVASPTGNGKVYVKGDSSYGGDINLDSDYATRTAGKSGTTYYINAQASSGYYFRGWSKTNSYSSINISATNKAGRNENAVLFNESNGYSATYYAMYAPYWKFSATGYATDAGGGTVTATVTKSEIEATDNSSSSASTTATFTATPSSSLYEFVGWTDSKNGTTPISSSNPNPMQVTITNTTPGSTATATYYAIFKSLTYTIYFKNDNPNVTQEDYQEVAPIGVPYTLPANKFIHKYEVTFDAAGGKIDNADSKKMESSTFSRWWDKAYKYEDAAGKIADQATITRTTSADVTLLAIWHAEGSGDAKKYKAPFSPSTPVLGDREFSGWYYSDGTKAKTEYGSVWTYSSTNLYAHWGDPFYAKVTLSKTATGTSGTPSADVTEKNSDYKNADLIFTITAPAASDGYHFTKWTGTNVTFDDATKQTGAKATVKSSETAGSSNARVGDITANYEPNSYSIVIGAAGTKNGESLVCNVSGPVNYRISVPVGESVTIKDVPLGDYTVTPETTWSWNSTFSPASVSISFTSSSGSQSKPANFTITSKGSTKKHDEVYNIEIP